MSTYLAIISSILHSHILARFLHRLTFYFNAAVIGLCRTLLGFPT